MPRLSSTFDFLKRGYLKKIFLVFVCLSAFRLPQKLRAQTLSIKKIHCSLGKTDEAEIRQIIHYETTFYDAVFDTLKNDSLPINVFIFGRKEDFRQTPNGENALQLSSDGYYLPNSNDIYLLKTDHLNEALLHETSHALLHQNMAGPPQWFDEGLATYFGSLVIEKQQILYAPITERIARIKEMSEKGTLNLAGYLNTASKRWYGSQATVSDQYTVAYGLIYFLIKTNLNLVKNLAEELKNGQSATAVLSQDFGGFEFFQSKFISFYKNQN